MKCYFRTTSIIMRTLYAAALLISLQIILLSFMIIRTKRESLIPTKRHAQKSGIIYSGNLFQEDNISAEGYYETYDTYSNDRLNDKEIAMDPRWPRRLLYIWCGDEEFTFTHYLSLQSAIRSINPSAVIFAFEEFPKSSSNNRHYNSWMHDIEDTFPFLIRHNISRNDHLCPRNGQKETIHIERFLLRQDFRGCLYLANQTVLIEPFILNSAGNKMYYYDQRTGQGFVYIPHNITNTTRITGTCMSAKFNDTNLPDVCFVLDQIVPDPTPVNLDPEYIMLHPSSLASQLRLILYGSRKFPYQHPDSRNPAPNVAHYAWLGGGQMSYTFYMSVLSCLYLGKVHKVFIHGNEPPAGELWHRLENDTRIKHVRWHRPNSIWGQHVKIVPHQADIVKSSVMFAHGGILMDPDLMFVRPPDREHFHYEALIMAGGHSHMLNPSVAISKPKSEYSRLWLESEKQFRKGYVWNCCYKMYKVWERKPQIAKVVRNFNLICTKGICFPMWIDKDAMRNRSMDLMANASDWKKQVVTVHFPRPNPYHSFKQCAYELTGVAGEVGRMILRAAGMLGKDEGLVP